MYTETANTLIVGGTANVNYGYGTLQVIGNAAIAGNVTTQIVNLQGGTNYFVQSANIANTWIPTQIQSVTSGYADPFGGTTAANVVPNTTNITHFISEYITTSGICTLSFYCLLYTSPSPRD